MTKSIITVSQEVQRRFILGQQGLWPGRRWAGKEGAGAAVKSIEAVQVDPVSVVAQSHDIVLWGRVHGYTPEHLQNLLYEDRHFFDYGGTVMIYPMEELPYWRVFMERRKSEKRWADFAAANPQLLAALRAAIRDQGPLRSRDVPGRKVDSYRGSQDTGVGLYYLWLTGELMTHHRQGKERVYDLLENVAPRRLQYTAPESEAVEFKTRKEISQLGMVDPRAFRAIRQAARGSPVNLTEAKATISQWLEEEVMAQIQVEGRDQPTFVLSSDLPTLLELQTRKVPPTWRPISTTTEEEVVLLSPLEYVSARGRAAKLFDFNYIWEIYKPADKRQYGPYTMPVLYGDRLVGRLDVKYDRPNQALLINGFWLEAWFEPGPEFAQALANGLSSFMRFLGATSLEASNLKPAFLRDQLRQRLV